MERRIIYIGRSQKAISINGRARFASLKAIPAAYASFRTSRNNPSPLNELACLSESFQQAHEHQLGITQAD